MYIQWKVGRAVSAQCFIYWHISVMLVCQPLNYKGINDTFKQFIQISIYFVDSAIIVWESYYHTLYLVFQYSKSAHLIHDPCEGLMKCIKKTFIAIITRKSYISFNQERHFSTSTTLHKNATDKRDILISSICMPCIWMKQNRCYVATYPSKLWQVYSTLPSMWRLRHILLRFNCNPIRTKIWMNYIHFNI